MTNLILKIYSIRFKNPTIDKSYYRFVYRLVNILLPIWYDLSNMFKLTESNRLKKRNSEPEYIISLTSFPARIDTAYLTIESLLRQSQKPDLIVLWLSRIEFDKSFQLPKKLLDLQKRGLDIRFVEENLRSHNKYYYAFQFYPNAKIVTVDDDVFYHPDFFSLLLEKHRAYPNAICSLISREITWSGPGEPLSYNKWPIVKSDTTPCRNLLPLGSGGVLYPPHAVHPDIFDTDQIMKETLSADDLWLKVMSMRAGTLSVNCRNPINRNNPTIRKAQKVSLEKENIGGGKNDYIFNRLLELYKPLFYT